MKIARVFPRRTKATPNDKDAFVGPPDMFLNPGDYESIHISVAFTWDLNHSTELANEWQRIAPVFIGGPATGQPGGDFVPGRYMKTGYVITSRGCPNRCPHCFVPEREGAIRELPISEGWNVLDDNLLACSENHVLKVFDMLRRQSHKPEFTGGFEARRFKPWHAEALRSLKTDQVFFAYDQLGALEPLAVAAETCWKAGFTRASHSVRSYVLIGYKDDTPEAAEKRLRDVLALGIYPFAMTYRGKDGKKRGEFHDLAGRWCQPGVIACMVS